MIRAHRFVSRTLCSAVGQRGGLSSARAVETEEWSLFPNEREGNEYMVNWSLTVDGISSAGEGFRNARLPILTTRLPKKVEGGKVELAAPEFSGARKLQEAGATISFDEFEEEFNKQRAYLSSGIDLFIEDRGMGSFAPFRLGARVVTDDAALALIFRTLLIPTPPRPVDHRARFNGWNFEERWRETELVWTGSQYNIVEEQTTPKKGQRPILACFAGSALGGKSAAVQFVEANQKLVGANVMAAKNYNVQGMIEALGHAFSGTFNEQVATAAALPSLSLLKSSETALVIGADDEFVGKALEKDAIYGAYHNVVSTTGTSAVWNGVIGPLGKTDPKVPSVVVNGKTARALNPNNLAHAPSHFFFVEKGASKAKLTPEEAVKRLVAASGEEGKAAVFEQVLKGAKTISVVGSHADVLN